MPLFLKVNNNISLVLTGKRYRYDIDDLHRKINNENDIKRIKNDVRMRQNCEMRKRINQLIEIEKNVTLLYELDRDKKENIIYNNFLRELKVKRELNKNLKS
tara:strand:- start:389 stop:694 length:306 start_codon:yes stop_codon:yes gene_type:complete